MPKHLVPLSRISLLIDLALVAASFFIGYSLRNEIQDIYPMGVYIGLLPILLIIWGSLLLYYFGDYGSFVLDQVPGILLNVLKIACLGFILFGSFTYVFKITYISRTLVFLIFGFSAVSICIEKILTILLMDHLRKKGFDPVHVLIVGTGKKAQSYIDLIHKHNEWGLNIVGLVDEDASLTGETVGGHKVLGTLLDVPDLLHHNVIDEVIFATPRSWVGRIEQTMLLCENEGVKINVAVDYFQLKFSNAKQVHLGGFPLLTFKPTTDKVLHLSIKRLLDIAISAAALVALAPLFLAVAAIIKFESKGPVFFKQKRCGLQGRIFTLLEFRTMVTDAEERLKELMAHNQMSGPVFKMDNDPRITRMGRLFRKFSIDELPQFWNVLAGDMSIVGPRPPIPNEVNRYDSWQRRRLSMKPGVTCLWQVNGRNKITDFNEWVKLDLEYIDNWSLGLEFKILLKTIPVVLFGVGAK